jgi:hypothetical protein
LEWVGASIPIGVRERETNQVIALMEQYKADIAETSSG